MGSRRGKLVTTTSLEREIMREKKSYAFNGSVIHAKGWFGKRTTGKSIQGTITVLGQVEDFNFPMGRVLKIGVDITQTPMKRLFPGLDLSGCDYPYVVRNLTIQDSVISRTGIIKFAFSVVQWDKISNIEVLATPNRWWHWILLREVAIQGEAHLFRSESIPSVARKL